MTRLLNGPEKHSVLSLFSLNVSAARTGIQDSEFLDSLPNDTCSTVTILFCNCSAHPGLLIPAFFS
ncbi:MAG: hypothetical protein RQ723_03785, partial [Desulfuromonadales bacterium]|nr:hypothetical protein [Desulfuromonadales bacterium]